MVTPKLIREKFIILLFFTLWTTVIYLQRYGIIFPKLLVHPKPMTSCMRSVSKQSITPLKNTKHFLVSAYMDQRVQGFDIRLIGMFQRHSVQKLHCFLCCAGNTKKATSMKILRHNERFGFAFITTDVMCRIPKNCNATHVTLLTKPKPKNAADWLPIRNKKTNGRAEEKMDFTVCISTLFGGYNNVLQFAQSLEMYRLLGVNRVVIYNTSCGPDLDRLLESYSQEGFLEIVSWPIDKYMNPSQGWLFSQHGGDIHYFGQITTLNDCVYRSMERSRYVLLNDIDEIIMPYQHDNLKSLMDELQKQHPKVGVFLIESHKFPTNYVEPSGRFDLPKWSRVPGINILEHVYREEPKRKVPHPQKIIVQPRMVEQTSVHEVLRFFGEMYDVPLDVCRIIHVRKVLKNIPKLQELSVDKRLWEFQEKLIPNVDKVLNNSGLLK